jgi:hypothetical protein
MQYVTDSFYTPLLISSAPLPWQGMRVEQYHLEAGSPTARASSAIALPGSAAPQEIQQDPSVQLLFQASAYAGFLSVVGTATISTDHARIQELWNPLLKAWFTEGENDPRLTAVEVTPQTGYYWDNKHGNLIAAVKTAVSAVIGQTLDDSIEGTLSV